MNFRSAWFFIGCLILAGCETTSYQGNSSNSSIEINARFFGESILPGDMVALVSIMADRHKNYGKEGDQATGPEQIYYGKILRSALEARGISVAKNIYEADRGDYWIDYGIRKAMLGPKELQQHGLYGAGLYAYYSIQGEVKLYKIPLSKGDRPVAEGTFSAYSTESYDYLPEASIVALAGLLNSAPGINHEYRVSKESVIAALDRLNN